MFNAMKYICLGMSLYLGVIAASCSTTPEEEPVGEPIEEPIEEGFLIVPSEELAQKSGSSLKELHIGFGVWVRECGTCHEHVLPDDVSSETWHAATPRMAWNANITDQEQDALLKYILAAKSELPDFGRQLEGFGRQAR